MESWRPPGLSATRKIDGGATRSHERFSWKMSDSAPPPSPSPAPAPPVEVGAFTFDWSRPRWGRTRLLTALTFAAAGHVLLFYLFQVVTPPSTRTLPPVRSTLLLSSTFAPSATHMERLEDQHPALMPPTPLAEPDAKALRRLFLELPPATSAPVTSR